MLTDQKSQRNQTDSVPGSLERNQTDTFFAAVRIKETMAAFALPLFAAALVMTSPVLSTFPLPAAEAGQVKPSSCDPVQEELRLSRLVEGMAPSAQAVADAADSPEEVWAARCASCHSMNGDASTTMGKRHQARAFTDPTWQDCRTDGDIRAAIVHGVSDSKMRAFNAHVSEGQLEGLVQLIRRFDMRVSRGQPIAFTR